VKTYGGNDTAPQPIQFALVVLRDEVPETHEFTAVPRVGAGDILRMLLLDEDKPEAQLEGLSKTISKSISDKDGEVNSKWKPEELKRPEAAPTNAWESAHGVVRDEPGLERSYRGPDGQIYPFSNQAAMDRWMDKSRWTSRRRWLHILLEDQDVFVRLSTLVEISKDFIAASTGHPTAG
jgi:hypothetical protein